MIVHNLDGNVIKMWTEGVQVEPEAMHQLENVARLPFVKPHVAAMPDVHAGMGATIGSVIPMQGAVVPAAVGVDIGCGVLAARTPLTRSQMPADPDNLWSRLGYVIPHGRTDNGGKEDDGAWFEGEVPEHIEAAWAELRPRYEEMVIRHGRLQRANAKRHLGTLGTGNHFVELAEDESGVVWVLVHSGSRGIGNAIGGLYTRLAKDLCRAYFIDLPDPNLAYIPEAEPLYRQYLRDAAWAQWFAKTNRMLMAEAALNVLGVGYDMVIDCHHNYVEHTGGHLLVRKGAVSAKQGQYAVIPGSMGTKSYVVTGKGNPDSFFSCSHGAGRAMSRTKARSSFSVRDHVAATEGVACCKDHSVLDETPGAYKDIDQVMEAQTDLVSVVHTLKQFVCLKG